MPHRLVNIKLMLLSFFGTATAAWDFSMWEYSKEFATKDNVLFVSGLVLTWTIILLNWSRIRLNKTKRKRALSCSIEDDEKKDKDTENK